jgi:hypothetical protein
MSNWISIKDRLPDCHSQHGKIFASGYVLTYDEYNEVDVNQLIRGGEHTENGWVEKYVEWQESNYITHWQPLPEPPKFK